MAKRLYGDRYSQKRNDVHQALSVKYRKRLQSLVETVMEEPYDKADMRTFITSELNLMLLMERARRLSK